jgi:hypothetical protein
LAAGRKTPNFTQDTFIVMRIVLAVLFCLLMFNANGQRPITAMRDSATIYLQGLELHQSVQVQLTEGRQQLVIMGLLPNLQPASLQWQTDADLVVLSQQIRVAPADSAARAEAVEQLRKLLPADARERVQQELALVAKQRELLRLNLKLQPANTTNATGELAEWASYHAKQQQQLLQQERALNAQLADYDSLQKQLQLQIDSITEPKNEQQLLLELQVAQAVKANFSISYFAPSAAWFPQYELRVKSVEDPLELVYKAQVLQQTNNYWQPMPLVLSSATPQQSLNLPELRPWKLNLYDRSFPNYAAATAVDKVSGVVTDAGEALPGVAVVVEGTSIGVVTDLNGRYSINLPKGDDLTLLFQFIGFETARVPANKPRINISLRPAVSQLDEVVVRGYSSEKQPARKRASARENRESYAVARVTLPPENQAVAEEETALSIVTYAPAEPVALPANGQPVNLVLKRLELQPIYQFYTAPVISPNVYLKALIINPEQYRLLAGEASLFYEDRYSGTTLLNNPSDTLELVLGQDRQLEVQRRRTKEYSKREFIGSDRTETVAFEIDLKNNKPFAVEILLEEQLPVPTTKEIELEVEELNGGDWNSETGIVQWRVQLQPGEQKQVSYRYKVELPRYMNLPVK